MSFKVLITDYRWPSLDIEREVLARVGAELVVAETGDEQELVALASDADAILTCWVSVPPAALRQAPRCRVVSRYGVGTDNIPVDVATELGILVTRVPDYCMDEVSDHAMALLLASARRVCQFDRATRAGVWDNAGSGPLPRLRGRTLGLVGFGNMARAVAPKAQAFGMSVVAFDPAVPPGDVGGTRVTSELDEVLAEADFLSVHVPLTDSTHHLLDADRLRKMKPTAYVINTARGPVVDEEALATALQEGRIGGAALDVMEEEPPAEGNPLVGLDNVILTPHAAFYSEASTEELQHKAADNVALVLEGRLPRDLYVFNAEVLDRPNSRFGAEALDAAGR